MATEGTAITTGNCLGCVTTITTTLAKVPSIRHLQKLLGRRPTSAELINYLICNKQCAKDFASGGMEIHPYQAQTIELQRVEEEERVEAERMARIAGHLDAFGVSKPAVKSAPATVHQIHGVKERAAS